MNHTFRDPAPLDPYELVALFHSDVAAFGTLSEISPAALPQTPRALLVHSHHMTDAMQEYHGSPVDVVVLDKRQWPDGYARKILLTRQLDQRVVQLGLVRLHWRWIPNFVREAVERAKTPLGRILDELEVMRSVELERLWRFTPQPEIGRLVDLSAGTTMFGRTARILVNHAAAIDLLEIAVLESDEGVHPT